MFDDSAIKRVSTMVNERILMKAVRVDYRRIEAARIKMRVRFYSADAKRYFVRFFSSVQQNVYYISTIAPIHFDVALIGELEAMIKNRCEEVKRDIDQAIDSTEMQFKTYGVTSSAHYDVEAFEIEVGVIHSIGRHYLEVLTKLDQLMPLLQTLEILEIEDTRGVDLRRSAVKRQVRLLAYAVRNIAAGLRRRANAGALTLSIDANHIDSAIERLSRGEADTLVPTSNASSDEDPRSEAPLEIKT